MRIRAVQEAAGRRQCHVHLAGIYAASGAAASSCSYRRYSLCTCSREIGCAYYVASRHAVTQMQVVCCGVVSDVGTRKPGRAMMLCYQHRAAQRCPRQGRGAGGGAEDGGVVGGPGAPHAEAQVPGGRLCAWRPPPAGGAPWPGARGGPPPAHPRLPNPNTSIVIMPGTFTARRSPATLVRPSALKTPAREWACRCSSQRSPVLPRSSS